MNIKKQKYIEVDLDGIKSMVDNWDRIYSIIPILDKKYLVVYTPKVERDLDKNKPLYEELDKIIKKRNDVEIPNENKIKDWNNKLPKVKKTTDVLKRIYIAKRKNYEYIDIIQWITNYLRDIVKRKPSSKELDDWVSYKDMYCNHRFELWKFLKQANWLDRFLNM